MGGIEQLAETVVTAGSNACRASVRRRGASGATGGDMIQVLSATMDVEVVPAALAERLDSRSVDHRFQG